MEKTYILIECNELKLTSNATKRYIKFLRKITTRYMSIQFLHVKTLNIFLENFSKNNLADDYTFH
jgi:hypothetical protein